MFVSVLLTSTFSRINESNWTRGDQLFIGVHLVAFGVTGVQVPAAFFRFSGFHEGARRGLS